MIVYYDQATIRDETQSLPNILHEDEAEICCDKCLCDTKFKFAPRNRQSNSIAS